MCECVYGEYLWALQMHLFWSQLGLLSLTHAWDWLKIMRIFFSYPTDHLMWWFLLKGSLMLTQCWLNSNIFNIYLSQFILFHLLAHRKHHVFLSTWSLIHQQSGQLYWFFCKANRWQTGTLFFFSSSYIEPLSSTMWNIIRPLGGTIAPVSFLVLLGWSHF